jgi:hypothetical protein
MTCKVWFCVGLHQLDCEDRECNSVWEVKEQDFKEWFRVHVRSEVEPCAANLVCMDDYSKTLELDPVPCQEAIVASLPLHGPGGYR